jgi:hypothetical protein
MPSSHTALTTFNIDPDWRREMRDLAREHGLSASKALRVLVGLGLYDEQVRAAWIAGIELELQEEAERRVR